MKTLILATLTQFLLILASFTILFTLSSNATDYQIKYFATSMVGILIPLAVFNIVGLGVIKLSVKNAQSHNFRRVVFGTSLVVSLIISLLMTLMDSTTKNLFGINLSQLQYFGIQTIFWIVVGSILAAYFIKNNQS